MNTSSADSRPRRDTASAVLWGSAAVLAGLIVAELAGPAVSSRPAEAQSPSVAGDMTIIPASAGDQEDVLMVLDGRSEKLSIYNVTNAHNKIDLLQTYDVNRLFQEARQAAGAQPRP
jgi:hypothetical protein